MEPKAKANFPPKLNQTLPLIEQFSEFENQNPTPDDFYQFILSVLRGANSEQIILKAKSPENGRIVTWQNNVMELWTQKQNRALIKMILYEPN